MPYSRQEIVDGLKGLGLKRGDLVLVRAALKAIGELDEKPSISLIKALLDTVGTEGTIIGLAFNKLYLFPKRHKEHIVSLGTPPVTGGLVKAMVDWPDARRSLHPTNSFVAIGKAAQSVIEDHDPNATCFQPIEKILKYDGKMILVGCVKSSPGFSSVHLAQERLGLATRSILRGLRGAYYNNGNETRLFKQNDVPTCSVGFSNFYSEYIKEEKLNVGYVGDAYSVAINARDAYEIEYRLLSKDPKIALCNDSNCISCRGTLLYNLSDMPKFYAFQIVSVLIKFFKKIRFSSTR